MFTAKHFIWIGLCALFVVVMCLVSRRQNMRLRTAGLIMTAICVLSEVCKVMSEMTPSPGGGMHLDPGSLPLHLCSLMMFAVVYITFGKESRLRTTVMNFVAVMGTLGSFFAILIPTNGVEFTTVYAYQCFVYHAGLMWFSLYLILSGHAEPGSAKNLAKNLGLLLALTFCMLYVNGALSAYDTNFFFLTRPPMEGLPYLNLDGGWYTYFLRLAGLGVALVTLFHLPFCVLRSGKRAGQHS